MEKCAADCSVVRNDELDLTTVLNYDRVILSPGPGLHLETKNLFETIQLTAGKVPVLGVCLGMQGIAEVFGGKLINQKEVKHGVQTQVTVCAENRLFSGLPPVFKVGLYHSWCVDDRKMPNGFKATSFSSEGVLMSIEHESKPIYAVQFHPESIMTEHGLKIIDNFLKLG